MATKVSIDQSDAKPARIAFLDIETAPNLGWTWGKWEQNVIDFHKYWYMLSFSTKWLGERGVRTYALPDYRGYKTNREDDSKLVRELWAVLDEADIVICHNGDKFDLRKSNARFITNGLRPPSPYKSIDTLKIARRHFAFTSNKLDDLGHYLGVGRKLPTTGARLWLQCMVGDEKAWDRMVRYNAQDVALLERVYFKLRPWSTSHPDLNSYSFKHNCPTCQSPHVQRRGISVTKTGKRERFQCTGCGSWFSGLKFSKTR